MAKFINNKERIFMKVKRYTKLIISGLLGALVASGVAVGVVNITRTEQGVEIKTEILLKDANAEVKYAEEEVAPQIDKTILETSDGNIAVEDIPTVESVDGGSLAECPEESTECARGAVLPPLDITSVESFYASVINQCIDFDGAWGSQCYDEMAYFHYVYTGRWLSTNGTGAAYGIWDARDYNNPVNPETGETYYEFVTDATQLMPGDFIIFSGGAFGHVGMAVGAYNNGYIALLGTNQGGVACSGGGSAANVINISLSNFRGAFRPRIWIQPEPAPAPARNCDSWTLQYGDTLGQIMLECEGYVEWGEAMNRYAKQWMDKETGIFVFDGWASAGGVGLIAGHTIIRK